MAARVLLVDDHIVVVQVMAEALRAAGYADVDYVASDSLDVGGALAAADRFRPDIALVDLNLRHGRSGLPIISSLVGRGVPVVAFTASDEELVLAECLEAGAAGFVDKTQSFEAVIGYMTRVLADEAVIPPVRREEMIDRLRRHRAAEDTRRRGFEELSPRERVVLSALLAGKAPQDIAEEQFVSVKTVRSQIESIHRKLGVRSQLAAVALAREVGWPPD